jgi:hypothetical protein
MGLAKAYLVVDGKPADKVDFTFNPKEVDIAKSSSWKDAQSRGAKKAPKKEFVGTNPRTMTFELLFDGWETGDGDVSPSVDKLLDWTCPTKESLSANKPQPPKIVFHWGSKPYFSGYIKQCNAKYTLFDDQGVPLRATVKLSLEQLPEDAALQNPTSGGIAGRRTYEMVAGDTLASVAYAEYRKPSLWRALAEANAIDDPLRVPPGTVLLVPPAVEAARLAAPQLAMAAPRKQVGRA